ncbi:hypothetical protein C0991_002218, partial [Blastosporella zonata]
KNLKIPAPTNSVLLTAVATNQAPAGPKKSNGKSLKAKEDRNLYLLDYLKTHPDYKGTEGQFTAIWKSCDPATKVKFEDLSKTLARERKKPAQTTTPLVLNATSAVS